MREGMFYHVATLSLTDSCKDKMQAHKKQNQSLRQISVHDGEKRQQQDLQASRDSP